MCGLTVLRCGKGFSATKTWRWNPTAGVWLKTDYTAGAWFHPREVSFDSIETLATAIRDLAADPQAMIVRGGLTPDTREALAANPTMTIRRRKLKRGDVDPSLMEVARSWIMIDVDSYRIPRRDDLIDNPQSVIAAMVEDLFPDWLQSARMFWQLSSSAWFAGDVLKCHLFVWLTEPIDNADLKRRLKQHAPGIVDLSPYSAAQPHFIAAPVIEGARDPLPRRMGWLNPTGDAGVVVPALRAEEPRPRPTTGSAMPSGGFDQMGDGEGLSGFHAPLLAATLSYARRCNRYGDRDDAGFIATLVDHIAAAPKRPDRTVEQYDSNYLQRIINGAFELTLGNADTPEIQPHHPAATITIETARDELKRHIGEFLDRVRIWHATPEESRDGPEHAALAVDVGSGKSTHTRQALPSFIHGMQERDLPARVLWLVPTHKLGGETLAEMQRLGINATVWRGRDAEDPNCDPGTKMCPNPDAVQDALAIGADVEAAVCGNPGGAVCPFRDVCGYQAQKAAAASADVVIAAHQVLYQRLPKTVLEGVGVVIVDESWWQAGLVPNRETRLASFASDLFGAPVLRDPDSAGRRRPKGRPRRQVSDDVATSELHELASKAERAFAAVPTGSMVTRDAVTAQGLTADLCDTARALEWRRKRENVLRPGMTSEQRKAALAAATVNSTIPRRAGIWAALRDLLKSNEQATGRLEIVQAGDAKGGGTSIMLHTRREIVDAVARLPLLYLDATLPETVARYFLPRLTIKARIEATTPHLHVTQVLGGWGKTSLLPHPRASLEENHRRDGLLQQLRDYVALHGRGDALVVTYQSIEDRFSDLPGVRTGHFNAIAGLDAFARVQALFVIGRPLPAYDEHRLLTLALTGRPIPAEQPQTETRGVRMADGTGRGIPVRAYADPDLEALRAAIVDAEIVQAIGRGRAVNRDADTPLQVHILADVVTPLVVSRLVPWNDVRPGAVERMAARGVVLTSGTDAHSVYPDLFPSAEAAKKAITRDRLISGTSPYEYLFIGECPGNTLQPVRYRPPGRGQQTRRAWVRDAGDAEETLTERLGPLAMFETVQPQPTATPNEAPMTEPEGVPPELPGGYGELLPLSAFPGSTSALPRTIDILTVKATGRMLITPGGGVLQGGIVVHSHPPRHVADPAALTVELTAANAVTNRGEALQELIARLR